MTPASRSESRSGTPPVPSAIVTLNGTFALKSVPSSWLTITDGIRIAGLAPPMAVGGPAMLFATITMIAPFTSALRTFAWNSQLPRSMSAILPAGFARYGSSG